MPDSPWPVGQKMATEPIVCWATAVWDNLANEDDLKVSWRKAMTSVAVAERPFSWVAGPAGAFVASALRIGWKIPTPFHVLAKEGALVCLKDTCPNVVARLARRAILHKEASETRMAEAIGGPPDLGPLKAYLHNIRRTKAVASLKALGEGGWWTQQNRFEAGMEGVDSPI